MSQGTPTEQVVALLTRIAEGVDTQNELLSHLLSAKVEDVSTKPHAPDDVPSTGDERKYRVFDAETLHVTIDEKGEKHFKVKGGPFREHGVTIWPEVLASTFGLDTEQLMPCKDGYAFKHQVRALLTAEGKLRKVVGLAE